MQITLNGEQISTEQTTLDELLAEQGYQDMVVATALNEMFIAKDQRADTKLEQDCRVEIVAPCLLYTSPSPRDLSTSRMPSSA